MLDNNTIKGAMTIQLELNIPITLNLKKIREEHRTEDSDLPRLRLRSLLRTL